jgi:hypothetical protein
MAVTVAIHFPQIDRTSPMTAAKECFWRLNGMVIFP